MTLRVSQAAAGMLRSASLHVARHVVTFAVFAFALCRVVSRHLPRFTQQKTSTFAENSTTSSYWASCDARHGSCTSTKRVHGGSRKPPLPLGADVEKALEQPLLGVARGLQVCALVARDAHAERRVRVRARSFLAEWKPQNHKHRVTALRRFLWFVWTTRIPRSIHGYLTRNLLSKKLMAPRDPRTYLRNRNQSGSATDMKKAITRSTRSAR